MQTNFSRFSKKCGILETLTHSKHIFRAPEVNASFFISDISLSEFQCPLCLKLLGSRAAVQRHAREVHRSSVPSNSNENIPPTVQTQSNNNSSPKLSSSLSCSRCGKLFQNKSNLKIHMLTHSGVKPFK